VPLSDAVDLDGCVIAIRIAWPAAAFAVKPCLVVLGHVVVDPLSGRQVEVGNLPSEVHEDHCDRVVNDRAMGIELPGGPGPSPGVDLDRSTVHQQPRLGTDYLDSGASFDECCGSGLESSEIVNLAII